MMIILVADLVQWSVRTIREIDDCCVLVVLVKP